MRISLTLWLCLANVMLPAAVLAWDAAGVPDPGPGRCLNCVDPGPAPYVGEDPWEREERRRQLREQHEAEARARAERERAYDSLFSQAQAAMAAGDWSRAEAVFRSLLAMREGPNGYYGVGYCLLMQGRYDEAQAAMEQSRRAGAPASLWKPAFTLVAKYRGHSYLNAQQWREAETQLRGALEFDAKDAWAWNALGSALDGQGRYAEAQKAMEKAARLDPGQKVYQDNVARMAEKQASAQRRDTERKNLAVVSRRVERTLEELRAERTRRDPTAGLQGFKTSASAPSEPPPRVPLRPFAGGRREGVAPQGAPDAIVGGNIKALDQLYAAEAAGARARREREEAALDQASEVFDKGGRAAGSLDTNVVDARDMGKEPQVMPRQRTPEIARLEQQRDAKKVERQVLEEKLAELEAQPERNPVAVVQLRQKVEEVHQTEVYLNFAITEALDAAPDPQPSSEGKAPQPGESKQESQ